MVALGLLGVREREAGGIVEQTIKVHRVRVMEKMQASSLADLVRLARRVGVGPR